MWRLRWNSESHYYQMQQINTKGILDYAWLDRKVNPLRIEQEIKIWPGWKLVRINFYLLRTFCSHLGSFLLLFLLITFRPNFTALLGMTRILRRVLETIGNSFLLGFNHQLKPVWKFRNANLDHPEYSIVKIDQNTEKCPGDKRKLWVTQIPAAHSTFAAEYTDCISEYPGYDIKQSEAGALKNAEYPFIAIAPRSTLARGGST